MTDQLTDRALAIQAALKSMCSDKDQLILKETFAGDCVIYNVGCSDADYARIIGAKGKNVAALELLTAIAAYKDGLASELIIANPENPNKPLWQKFEVNPAFKDRMMADIVKQISAHVLTFDGVIKCRELDRQMILVEIEIDQNEDFSRMDEDAVVTVEENEVMMAMRTLFVAIGKSNGRDIRFYLTRKTAEFAHRK